MSQGFGPRGKRCLTGNSRSLLWNAMPVRPSLVPIRFALVFLLGLSLAGCAKKHGTAIVVAKEHIDAAAIKPSPSLGVSPASEEPVILEMAPDEIVSYSEGKYTGTVWGSEIED